MKIKVLKPFRDKHTGVKYFGGTVVEVTRERATEIADSLGEGYFEILQAPEEVNLNAVSADESTSYQPSKTHSQPRKKNRGK